MSFTVRPARVEDVPAIVSWTVDTFEWGDYVPRRLPEWIDDHDSLLLVCVDDVETPLALAHTLLLSPREGWLEAARVRPDHRREGMASALNRAGVAWVRKRGARVARLAIEEGNEAARRQVESLGYRNTSGWVHAEFAIGPQQRCPVDLRLRPAGMADVDAAWMFWSTSELAHTGRGLIAQGWQWRKATPDDLVHAAESHRFFQSPAGWAVVDQPEASHVRAIWTATSLEDTPSLLDGLLDMAAEHAAEKLTLMLPAVPWATEALIRAGAATKDVLVYALEL